MSSTYNTNLIRSRASYTIDEVANLYSIDRKTCSRWVKQGLRVIQKDVKPLLIMGEDLKFFIKAKQEKRKTKLKDGEYYCFKCQRASIAIEGSQKIIETGRTVGKNKAKQLMKIGRCVVCGSKINRLLKVYQKGLKNSE